MITIVLLAQLAISIVSALLFWWFDGMIAAYSALLGGLNCVIPNAFLALRLSLPAVDARSVLRAAYLGELGKLLLTALMFSVEFIWIKPLAAGPLFTGFILAQLVTFAGFLVTGQQDKSGKGDIAHGS